MPSQRASEANPKLGRYAAKRDFAKTPEPLGAKARAGRRLIVQHHLASHDHYDFRLEIDGVLASWAVPKGPSANPKDKRLAVRTEDHPLGYASFEGLIPKGQYGGGTVVLWESTTYQPLNGDPDQALAKGELKIRANGERLRGDWVLVRMATRDAHENWLLIKERDSFAEKDDSLVRRFTDSAATGRSQAEIEAGKAAGPAQVKPNSRKKSGLAAPKFVPPELCTLVEEPPTSAGWLIEMKYDGYRLQLSIGGGGARIYTRAGLDWTEKFPRLSDAARALKCRNALIDGEGVVFDAKGITDFAALVGALEAGDAREIIFIAFDLLMLDGEDLRRLPLIERKQKLSALVADTSGALRIADYVADEAAEVFEQATRAGAEGIVAKRAQAAYVSGRSRDWLKIKAARREDVLIIGYMPSSKGQAFASLLAAVENADTLSYVGRIGTGYSEALKKRLGPLLRKGAIKQPPGGLGNREKLPGGAMFLAGALRAEVRFGGWTGDAQMRQARFLGLREDRPVAVKPQSPNSPRARAKGQDGETGSTPITHPDRVVFPDDGVTKGEIAEHYAKVAALMGPHLDGRLVSIVRAPDTIAETFFQRHPLKGMTRGIVAVDQGADTYMALQGGEGLQTAAQFGAVEIHGWLSRYDEPDRPDRLIFDLDPDPTVEFGEVKSAAKFLAAQLETIGLTSFPMVTGGKGVHVICPLDRSLATEEVEMFARVFAQGLGAQMPQRFVASMSKARRAGRIFIDWMRNKRAATAVLPWSLRARPDATMAVPLTWKSLAPLTSSAAFRIRHKPVMKNPWPQFFAKQQTIPARALSFARKRDAAGLS